MNLLKNISLQPYNTFGIRAYAHAFASIDHPEDLLKVRKLELLPRYILGGGSNILISGNLEGVVLKNNLRGIEIVGTKKNAVLVKISSGENWHNLVLWALKNDFGGIENLSLIPGTAGAAPIQNIGAYGVELKDVLESVDYFDFESGKQVTLDNEACQFDYRNSIFKKELKEKTFITSISLWLSKGQHKINMSYSGIESQLKKDGIKNPDIRQISNAVISLRQSKLPDPVKYGNAGSFFKNPIITQSHFKALQTKFPDIKFYPLEDKNYVKIPAAWLIDQCGWKGKSDGRAGTYHKQALVIVNHGNAKGEDILNFAKSIVQSVFSRFGIRLQPEVNIW